MRPDLQAISDLVLTHEELKAIAGEGTVHRPGGTISVEGPLVRVQSEIGLGPMDYERLLRICEEVIKRQGRFSLLTVAGPNTPSMGPDQRRLIAHWSKEHPATGIAVVSPQTGLLQAMTTLLIRAISMLSKHTLPLAFFRNEPDARIWLRSLSTDAPPTVGR